MSLKRAKIETSYFQDFVGIEEPLVFDSSVPFVLFNFRFSGVNDQSDLALKQKAYSILFKFPVEEEFYNLIVLVSSLKFFVGLYVHLFLGC